MFVYELHDVAKLLDRDAIEPELQARDLGSLKGKGWQSFSNVTFKEDQFPQPNTDTWKAIIRHEEDDKWEDLALAASEEVEFRLERFVTTLADRFASSLAREPRPGTQDSPRVKKLWGTQEEDRTIKGFENFRDLFRFLNEDPPWETFIERYGEATLRGIPEDRRAPFTSLYNHLRLTGKIARVLKGELKPEMTGGFNGANYRGTTVTKLDEAHGSKKRSIVGRWQFALVKLWATFPHHIVRLQDLHILRERRQSLERLAQQYRDNVLYFTEDFALLFFPEWDAAILRGLGDFQWRFRIIRTDLTTMSSNLDDLDRSGNFRAEQPRRHQTTVRQQNLSAEVAQTMAGELCPVCQLREATKPWRKGLLQEQLCLQCHERRDAAAPAEEYSNWDELDVDVAWIKLSVWPDIVRKTVQELFAEAVGGNQDIEAFRPLPLEMDFLDDYAKVRSEWHEGLIRMVAPDQLIHPVQDYEELVIVRLDKPDSWVQAVNAFCDAMGKYMPKAVEKEAVNEEAKRNGNQAARGLSPIQIFVDISSTKFPFHEHWRYFSQPERADQRKSVNVRDSRRRIDISVSVRKFRNLCKATESIEYRRPLHELAELWEQTNSRAAVLLSGWERRAALEKLLHPLGRNILDFVQFARLVS